MNEILTINRNDNPKQSFGFDSKLFSLPIYECIIMVYLLAHSDDKNWTIYRSKVQEEMHKKGMGASFFRKSWMSLQKKGYIVKNVCQRYVKWTVNEDPELK